jgi:hypothetical protein
MNQEQISEALHSLINDFAAERAYTEISNLSSTSQSILVEMRSNIVNAQHIFGDISHTDDPAVKKLSISICIRNLQTFVEATAAARELYLILPDRLVNYQDRAGQIIKMLEQANNPG